VLSLRKALPRCDEVDRRISCKFAAIARIAARREERTMGRSLRRVENAPGRWRAAIDTVGTVELDP